MKPVERCPLCEGDQFAPFERIQEGEHTLDYQICLSCGLVFQSPRMSDKALEDFYRAQYRRHVQGEEGPSEKDRRVQAGRARSLLDFVRRHVDRVEAHLDIGSSTGALLRVFREAYGCRAVGVEPGDAYREFSQRSGLEVVADLEELDRGDRGGFDLISMVHVLEHLPDPVGTLRDVRRDWSAPGGFLLIEVPNLFGHQALELAHLTAFHDATLRHTLARAGFELLELRAHGRPRSRLIPLYLTVLARKGEIEVSPERLRGQSRGVRLRRRLGMAWNRWAGRVAPGLAWLPWPELE